MNSNKYHHLPVLLEEVMTALSLGEGEIAVDVTAGGGGHLAKIAEAVGKNGLAIGLDRDLRAHEIDASGKQAQNEYSNVKLFCSPFSALPQILEENQIHKVDALLCDLGVSSPQLDDQRRGFSFMREGPLDMRMDQTSKTTAYDLLQNYDESELADIIYQYGEERRSRRIARAIKRNWPIENSTLALAELISKAVGGRRGRIHPATKTFQALRIATNNELRELDLLLAALPSLLKPNGRAVFISFHSLEDRKIKHAFRLGAQKNTRGISLWRVLYKKPLRATPEEISLNPRSRSAKLRAVEKLGEE